MALPVKPNPFTSIIDPLSFCFSFSLFPFPGIQYFRALPAINYETQP